MFHSEDNKPKINKYLTPMIAAGVFLVFVVISLLLSKQDMRRFLIILLLLSIIGLCAYFIYSLRKAEKDEPVEDQDDSTLLSRLPLRTDLFKRREETPVEDDEPSDLYSYRAEVGVTDNLFGLDDEPMVFDTNRARRTEDSSIIRREDPTERDFEDYHMDMAEAEAELEEKVPETVPPVVEDDQVENSYRYERKPIERPAFRGFTRSLDTNVATTSEVEEVKQHRTTFEPARETESLFQGNFSHFVEEPKVEEPAPVRETTFSTNKPFRIPSLDDEPEVTSVNVEEKATVQETVNKSNRDNFRIPEVGNSDNNYRSTYNKDALFQGTVGSNTPSKSSKPAETGLFGGSGYKSPFDK